MDLLTTKCNCDSNKDYQYCCGPYILGTKLPDSPEQLMRSRYTAYSSGNIGYIANSMCGKALHGFNMQEAKDWAKSVSWLRLEVLSVKLASKAKGFVEFKAYFIDNLQHCVLHENSEFQLIKGQWFYVDGVILND